MLRLTIRQQQQQQYSSSCVFTSTATATDSNKRRSKRRIIYRNYSNSSNSNSSSDGDRYHHRRNFSTTMKRMMMMMMMTMMIQILIRITIAIIIIMSLTNWSATHTLLPVQQHRQTAVSAFRIPQRKATTITSNSIATISPFTSSLTTSTTTTSIRRRIALMMTTTTTTSISTQATAAATSTTTFVVYCGTDRTKQNQWFRRRNTVTETAWIIQQQQHRQRLLLNMQSSSSSSTDDTTEGTVGRSSYTAATTTTKSSSNNSNNNNNNNNTTTDTTTVDTLTSTKVRNIQQQTVIVDGPEWDSIQRYFRTIERPIVKPLTTTTNSVKSIRPSSSGAGAGAGVYTIVTGTLMENESTGSLGSGSKKDDKQSKQQREKEIERRFVAMQYMISSSSSSHKRPSTNDEELMTLYILDPKSNNAIGADATTNNTIQVYKESMTYIQTKNMGGPGNKYNTDAILYTMIQSFIVHICRPIDIVPNIGGSNTTTIQFKDMKSTTTLDSVSSPQTTVRQQKQQLPHVVIVGCNSYSIQLATIYNTIFPNQYTITVVGTTDRPPKELSKSTSSTNIKYLPPGIERSSSIVQTDDNDVTKDDDDDDDDLIGFSNAIQQFDVLIDTIGTETDSGVDDDNDTIDGNNRNIIQILQQQHNCSLYCSTISQSQLLIIKNGVGVPFLNVGGPKLCTEHIQSLIQSATVTTTDNDNTNNKNNNKVPLLSYIPSPHRFSSTVEAMFNNGMVLSPPPEYTKSKVTAATSSSSTSYYIKGWNVPDFWEYTSWPRDASTNARFGFPTISSSKYEMEFYDDYDYDDDDNYTNDKSSRASSTSSPFEKMLQQQQLRKSNPSVRTKLDNYETESDLNDNDDDNDNDNDLDTNTETSKFGIPNSNSIVKIRTVKELQMIVQQQLTCVVFVSAPFCRTCKYLKPQYIRMVRDYYNNNDKNEINIRHIKTGDDKNFMFLQAEASSGQIGKEIGRALDIDTVPTFIFYKNGRRYGAPITNISRLPSKILDDTIQSVTKE